MIANAKIIDEVELDTKTVNVGATVTLVQVESKKNQVVINLSKINVSGNLYIKANQIDLGKGNFVFDFMKKA